MKTKEQTAKVLQKMKEPAKENLNTYERIGLISGGALLAFAGLTRIKNNGWPLTLAGGALAISGVAGKNPLYFINSRSKKRLKVKTSVTINKGRQEVYDFWRKLENLPSFMDHIQEVREMSDKKSHWKAEFQKVKVEWDAEITEDTPGKKISWRSLPDSEVQTVGHVEFKDALASTGTELTVELSYADNTGKMAKAFASLYHPVFGQQVKEELKRCKTMLETGKKSKPEPQPYDFK